MLGSRAWFEHPGDRLLLKNPYKVYRSAPQTPTTWVNPWMRDENCGLPGLGRASRYNFASLVI